MSKFKEKWRHFLNLLWGEPEKDLWAFIAYKGGATGEFKQKAYLYPKEFDELLNDLEQLNEWADIYFCPHLFVSSRERTKQYAASTWALWADKDSGSVEDLQPKPTICWQTSEGRYQAVWLVTELLNPLEAEEINRRLTYQTKSDKGGWYIGKVIRLPESINYKYSPPGRGRILWEDGPTYHKKDFEISESFSEVLAEMSEHKKPMPKKLPEISDVLLRNGSRIPSLAWRIINTEPTGSSEWSDTLWKLERLLAEAGLPPEDIFVLAKNSPWNKYARDKRPEEHLWAEVLKATEDKAPVEDEEAEELPWVTLDDVMIHAEKPSWLVQDVWMEKNVGWIAGVGKSFKSFISLDLALSVSTGSPFLGKYQVIEPGPVLMVQEEDPLWRVAHRIQMMAHKKGISGINIMADDTSWVMELKKQKIPLYMSVSGGFNLGDETKMDALERAIDRQRPKMVILDPMFMMSAGVDEFKASEVTPMLHALKSIRDRYGCAISVVHHYKKGNGDSKERIYGSMAMYAWSENSLLVSREGEPSSVVIEKDIKDASSDTAIAVEFEDLTDDYIVNVTERTPEGAPTNTYQAIVDFLKTVGRGEEIGRQQLAEQMDVSTKTVTNYVKKLEEEGKVITNYAGKGGKCTIIPTKLIEKDIDKGGEISL